ncbi:MAG: 50S ribosomal protein L19 [Chlamydiia bacterium]|nr:50S ribosomal protein L19 [Chlamydiia bacterium]
MSRKPLLEAVENFYKKHNNKMPKVGSTFKIGYIIKEGSKTRVQSCNGIVVSASKPNSIMANFSIYRAVGKIGVLRKFILNSPLIDKIEMVIEGVVRKAKVNYIIGKAGKSAKVKIKT